MKDLHVFSPLGLVNSSLVRCAEKVVVIDTGGALEQGQELARQAKELGEVAYVLNTHEHGDHLAGNHLFNCPIISSDAARSAMARSGLEEKKLPTMTFNDALTLHLAGEEVLLRQIGGHSSGTSTIYWPSRKLLFTGDLVFNGRVPWMGQADFALWIKNLDELLSLDVETVVPGHGPVGGKEILAQQRDWLEQFVQDVRAQSAAGLNPDEIHGYLLGKYPVNDNFRAMLRLAVERALGQ